MNDLGYKPPKGKEITQPVSTEESEDPKIQYPTLRFNGQQAEKGKLADLKFGEEFETTIRFRVTSIGGNTWERGSDDKPAVEAEVLAMDDPKEVGEESGDEEEPKRKPRQREVGPDQSWKEEYKTE
jgi:hypothetical protein